MVDRLVECVPHLRISTIKVVSANDPYADPFAHGARGFPHTMMLEGLNQSAALLYQFTYGKIDSSRLPLLGYLKADFTVPVSVADLGPAGEIILLDVRAIKMTPTHGLFAGVARIGQETMVRAELAFAVVDSGGVQ